MYNAKNYIGNCIESLLHQNISEDDYEIIIIDDGSTDNSVEIVNEYAKCHKNIVLHKKPNSGAYTTRNKLLKLAKGDYIYNLDADDYIVHNSLMELLEIAEINQLDIIGFETTETSSLDKLGLSKAIKARETVIIKGKEFIENYPHLRHEIWWYFIKKDFMLKHNMTFNTNEYNADVMFTLEALLEADKVGYLPISIHRYVQTQDSLMRSKNFDITCKRIEYIQMMIDNSSKLISKVESESYSDTLITNMKHRRDVFTFFNIVNMLRNPFGKSYIKDKIDMFKAVNAYPIKNFTQHRYNTFLYRILTRILNSESMLYALLTVKNTIIRPVK
jgi:glycosyltransferase involved in cell wall biosynthesis